MESTSLRIDYARARQLAEILASAGIPAEHETAGQAFQWNGTTDELANAYLAIVAICHQTSPVGERQLRGRVDGAVKRGWDYLKEKYLVAANLDSNLSAPECWRTLTPQALAEIYRDLDEGLTLNRINERAFLLNDLGRMLMASRLTNISQAFAAAGGRVGGENGLLAFLGRSEAYSDPLHKKGLFFLSLTMNECGWVPADQENMLSPIDYHELRGHLRLGTIAVVERGLSEKVRLGLPLDDADDLRLRQAAQEVNNFIAEAAGVSNSALHYLQWNLFRNCCPREAGSTHCSSCPSSCDLPQRYKEMPAYSGRCLFAGVCESGGKDAKLTEPPYTGHYY